jgi:hypothetical protein
MSAILCALMPLAISFGVSAQPVPTCKLADDKVETFIASKARELEGHESCPLRRYDAVFDLDGDRKADFIVLFSVGVGSGSVDFLAVWLSGRQSQPPLLVEVSEPEERTGVGVNADPDGKIHVKTLEWRSGDAHCCPSGKGELVYEVKGDKLQLVAKRSQRDRRK